MKPATPFTEMATVFRTRIVKQWAMKQDDAASSSACFLTEHARRTGLIKRERSITGSAMAEWGRRQETPLWAALAAFDLEITSGWRPHSNEEWAGFASLYLKIKKTTELDSLLEGLPEGMDGTIAAGWLAAAVEEDQHYRSRKKVSED
ncbi:hypothetical protein [Pantoea agglomerans]